VPRVGRQRSVFFTFKENYLARGLLAKDLLPRAIRVLGSTDQDLALAIDQVFVFHRIPEDLEYTIRGFMGECDPGRGGWCREDDSPTKRKPRNTGKPLPTEPQTCNGCDRKFLNALQLGGHMATCKKSKPAKRVSEKRKHFLVLPHEHATKHGGVEMRMRLPRLDVNKHQRVAEKITKARNQFAVCLVLNNPPAFLIPPSANLTTSRLAKLAPVFRDMKPNKRK
jgi:hypothetical protein